MTGWFIFRTSFLSSRFFGLLLIHQRRNGELLIGKMSKTVHILITETTGLGVQLEFPTVCNHWPCIWGSEFRKPLYKLSISEQEVNYDSVCALSQFLIESLRSDSLGFFAVSSFYRHGQPPSGDE